MHIGFGSYISPKSKIISLNGGLPKDICIGDYVYIGDDVQIICDSFHIGDYSKIHHNTNIHGKSVHIGHNAWIGQYTIIDGLGGTSIGNNCGIGAHSQLWSHMRYGDTLEGCRFDTVSELIVGNDVWFVGHCIVSPIQAEDKSMALVGSVITKNMEYNHTYAGCPARDITDKFGSQFADVTIDQKMDKLTSYWQECGSPSTICIVASLDSIKDDGKSYFDVSTRQYIKTLSDEEHVFMKYLLPTRAKFTPLNKKI